MKGTRENRNLFENEFRLHAVLQLDGLEIERLLPGGGLGGIECLGAAHHGHIVVENGHHVVVRIVDVETLADGLSDGLGQRRSVLLGVPHRLDAHLGLIAFELRVRHFQDRSQTSAKCLPNGLFLLFRRRMGR